MQRKGLIALVMLIAGACASKKQRLVTFDEAWGLRGRSFEEVSKVLGKPNDQDTKERAYWFLSEEPKYHPEPTPVMYSFVFSNGKLQKIERAAAGVGPKNPLAE